MAKHWRDSMNERNQDWINNRDKPKEIVTKASTQKYRDNWDKIFGAGGGKSGTSDNQKPTE